MTTVLDSFGRTIDYMRISITDRCNLRCKYCMPSEGIEPISHNNVLRYEELLRICKIALKNGIRNFRVTGGEPLLRKGCLDFLKALKDLSGHVSITTNGILLEPALEAMAAMEIDGINISLDSLNPNTYQHLTGKDLFPTVWNSLCKAVDMGFKVKVNCVPMKGVNDMEIASIAQLTEKMPLDVRFIEFMPSGTEDSFKRVTSDEIIGILKEVYPDLSVDERKRGNGPARHFASPKLLGRIGIIDAIGNCFCERCNRVRLTSDGFLKMCLFHENTLDLRTMLRSSAGDNEIEAAFRAAVLGKPERYFEESSIKNMSQVGG